MTLTKAFVSAGLLALSTLAHALEVRPYTPQALAELQGAGKPVALHFHADWCPTCRAQDRSIAALAAKPGLDMTLLTVDYDKERALEREYRVATQSTIVVLRGRQETGRLVGDTSVDGIRAALASALGGAGQ